MGETERATRRDEVLALLKERGADGISRPDVPYHLAWSLPARIRELREEGHRIDSVRDGRFSRYVLVATTDSAGKTHARP